MQVTRHTGECDKERRVWVLPSCGLRVRVFVGWGNAHAGAQLLDWCCSAL